MKEYSNEPEGPHGDAMATGRASDLTTYQWIEAARGEVVADGKRLEAVGYGPPPNQSPTIVMLHEGLGCVELWRDFPARLAGATGCGCSPIRAPAMARPSPSICRVPSIT
jgi:hypothetical protein